MNISGYRRANGTFGIRNHVIVLPTSVCASQTAVNISHQVAGTIPLPHQHGCCQVGEDYAQTVRTLIGLGNNPNVGGVLLVTLGCEGIQASPLMEAMKHNGKPVDVVSIQETGGTLKAIEKGSRLLRELVQDVSQQPRVQGELRELILGMECGGSDATSGLVGNPAIGIASDRLIEAGGTSMLSETTELIGAEHILARRAVTPKVSERLLQMVKRTEQRAFTMGVDIRGSQPTPGNIEGGLTTIEEKSLGCIYKAGYSAQVQDVLEYGEAPKATGLYFMDTPGQDIESITGMVAGGAQVVVFTTGRGTPTGCPIAPVIKITGNPETYERMEENIDINGGKVISDGVPLETVADEIFDEILAVCNGKLTKAETLGHHEFAIFRVGYTF